MMQKSILIGDVSASETTLALITNNDTPLIGTGTCALTELKGFLLRKLFQNEEL